MMDTDPITFAVIKNALDSIADEMAYTVLRTARSEIVKDVMDYSAAICGPDGAMLAQAKTIALHLGAVPEAISHVMAEYGDDINPGDAIILNDPYQGGMHLPDIFMFVPIFHGGTLQGFGVVICHHTDVGGRVPGSNASDSTEIYQEGLRLPVLKLYDRGVPNDIVFSIIDRNVRLPDRVIGDLQAQHAACHVGAREMGKLFDRYGAQFCQSYFAELLDYAERMTRAQILEWPDGTYRFTDYIDNDGFTDTPIPITVAITVEGDRLIVDYEGSSPQVPAALNSTKSYTNSCTYLSVRSVLSGDVPNNAGVFRCVEVRAPEASVLNPMMPAACAGRALTGYRVVDAMFGALAQIVPDRVPAAGEGGNTVISLGGAVKGKQFIIVDMICGAWGGRPDQDGIEAVTNPSQNLSNTPVEVMERQHPVRIEEYALIRDSCGAGKWRGGLGITRSYRMLADSAVLQLRSDRVVFQPYGLAGGGKGRATRNVLTDDQGQDTPLPGKVTMTMTRNQVIRHEQAGAGGFGNPLDRAPEAVAFDVMNDKISSTYARNHHKVAVDPATGVLDVEETRRLRSVPGQTTREGGVAIEPEKRI